MTLVVAVEEVARRLGLPQPLGENDRWAIEQALVDAQADVEAYLGRPVTPREYVETGMLPVNGSYQLAHHPVLSVASAVAEVDETGLPTGRFTVTYIAGLDGAADPELEPIRRFIRAHAIYSPGVQALFRRVAPEAARRVVSLGVEGQNVTYGDTYPVVSGAEQQGLAGAVPALRSLDRWRLAGRRVHMPPTQAGTVWPYYDGAQGADRYW